MFYDRYIEICEKRSKKPYSVSKELELSSSNVAQWKKGSTPRPAVLQKIADYFDVPVSYFFEVGGQKEPPPENPEAADPVKQQLHSIIDRMSSRGKLIALLEKAEEIEKF